jgi:uncharacterized protein YcfL
VILHKYQLHLHFYWTNDKERTVKRERQEQMTLSDTESEIIEQKKQTASKGEKRVNLREIKFYEKKIRS